MVNIKPISSRLDQKIFQKVFEQYYKPLCRFAQGYINDADSSEEIVQQVFINLWNQRESIDPGKDMKSYLFTSVRNRCLNYIRDHKKFRSQYLDVETELHIPVFDFDKLAIADLEKQVNDAIMKLPEKCREVFVLVRFEEMKYKETADHLGISVKTVEAQMSKAFKILREELKDIWALVLYFIIRYYN